MRHCIPRSEWHFWYFGVQIAASQNRPEVLIAESVAVLELGVNRTAVEFPLFGIVLPSFADGTDGTPHLATLVIIMLKKNG